MKVDIQHISSCKKTLRIEVPPEDVNAEFEKTYEEVRKSIGVPGFRKGRTPRNILKMRFDEYIKNEVFEKLIPSAFQKALEESDLAVVGKPDISPPLGDVLFTIGTELQDDLDNNVISVELQQEFGRNNASLSDKANVTVEDSGKIWLLADEKNRYRIVKGEDKINVYSGEIPIKENEPLIFDVTVDIMPNFDIPDLSSLEIDKGDVNVTKEEADQALEILRDQKASFVPIEGRNIQDGDYAILDIKLIYNNEMLEDNKDQLLQVKEDQLVPEFYQNLIGMGVGEEKSFSASFPEDYHTKELAGKEIVFHITLNKITEKRLPVLDDDFAKDQGEENLEKLGINLWNQLIEERRIEKRSNQKAALVAQLLEKTQFDVPEFLVTQQVTSLTQNIADKDKLTEENMLSFRNLALSMIKRNWILDAIAKNEHIEVNDEELEAEVERQATAKKRDPQKYMSQLRAINRLDSIRNALKEEKVFDMLIDKAYFKHGLIV